MNTIAGYIARTASAVWKWARSSAVEHTLDMGVVRGSIPLAPTISVFFKIPANVILPQFWNMQTGALRFRRLRNFVLKSLSLQK